jgi:hypothetical protein
MLFSQVFIALLTVDTTKCVKPGNDTSPKTVPVTPPLQPRDLAELL